MLKFARLLPALLCLLFALIPAAAQESGDVGWPVVERCVGEPTTPPKGWTFEGTILLRGYAGIHGVNAEWETPRVMAFIPNVPGYDAQNIDGILSPNQKWYAVTHATAFNGGLWVAISIYEIVVYSTITAHEKYVIPWENQYFGYIRSLRWKDDNHLLYETSLKDRALPEYHPEETFLINPFIQETENWLGKVDPFPTGSFFASPDWTRSIYDAKWFKGGWDAEIEWGVYDPNNGDQLASLPLSRKYPSIAWSPDSSQFAALLGEFEQNQNIALFDRDGQFTDTVLSIDANSVVDSGYDHQVIQWTADNRYIIFPVGTLSIPRKYELYVANLTEKKVINTCISIPTSFSIPASSPDGKMLAINGSDDSVTVLDLETWVLYTVAYHDGDIIGWRGD